MLFEVRMMLTVDAIDRTQVEIIALGALQAAKAHVYSKAARVVGDTDMSVRGPEDMAARNRSPRTSG